MKTRIIHTLLILSFTLQVNAQKEYNIWYFGDKAGINFNTSPPSGLLNNKLQSSEASSGICDANGNLLFYTNGDTVMNRLHKPMKNGIFIPNFWIKSAAQGAIVVPVPGSCHLYYIFHSQAIEKRVINGYFRYSIIDMDRDIGFGEVVVSQKPLFPNSDESMAITLHANKFDYWVASVNQNTGEFNFIRTVNGTIDTTLHKKKVRLIGPNDGSYIKFSPDSKILFESGPHYIDTFFVNLFKFENNSGRIYNQISLPLFKDYWSFGEFSPDSRYIYMVQSKWGFPRLNRIVQLDLANWNKDSILKSAKTIYTSPTSIRGLQLGPNGKIYVFSMYSDKLSTIHFPDLKAPSCSFKENDCDLGGRKSWSASSYYPTFKINTTKNTKPYLGNDTVICENSSLLLSLWYIDTYCTKIKWSTGNKSNSITVNKAGMYWVKIYNGNDSLTDTINITIAKKFKVYLGPDTAFCGKFTHLLNAGNGFKKYNWSTGDTIVSVLINKPDWYSVTVKNSNNCAAGDTILVDQLLAPDIFLNYDSITCKYVYLSAKIEKDIKYLWNTGDTGTYLKVDKKGIYRLTASNKFCNISKDILIDRLPLTSIKLGNDTIVCSDEIVLKCNDGKGFEWNTGERTASIKVRKDGEYWVTSQSNGCKATDSIKVWFNCDTITYYIPNAFSPNGDKNNDVFRVTGSNIDHVEIIIFDRWGEKLIETSGSDPYWDGSYKNTPCQQSAYFYMVKMKGKKAGDIKYTKGTVTLLK